MTTEEIINNLRSQEKDLIYKALYCLDNIFDSYYQFNEQTFMTIMDSMISLCISPEIYEDRELFEELLGVLESSSGHNGIDKVNFDPLVELFGEKQFSDHLWRLVIILGFSLQPKYINFLESIITDDNFLKKEIADAIFELKHSRY